MIPTSYLQEWSAQAPWPDLQQVEQDLIICRALCDLFNSPALADKITFRGGTAINKLLSKQPLRYSVTLTRAEFQTVHPASMGLTIFGLFCVRHFFSSVSGR